MGKAFMTDRVIDVDVDACTGCRLCETFCSVFNEGVCNPDKSRIRVSRWEWEGFQTPVICRHCDPAPCISSCPVGALFKEEKTGAVKLDHDLCIRCGMCTLACSYGAISFDKKNEKMKKCELCSDDPPCVRCCETEAVFLSQRRTE